MEIKAAFSKLKTTRNIPLFYFFCEQGEDGKPVLLFDTKKVPDDDWKPIFAKAKKKNKSIGTCEINDDSELVVDPVGSVPTGLAKGIQIAARNNNCMNFNGIVIKGGTAETKPAEQGKEEPTATPGDHARKPFSKVAFTQSRLLWDTTRKKAQTELQTLETAILAACKKHNEVVKEEDRKVNLDELATKVKKLYDVLGKLDDRLLVVLDKALEAPDETQRDAHHKDAEGIVKEYMKELTNPDYALIDKNGFTQANIRQNFIDVLKALATKL